MTMNENAKGFSGRCLCGAVTFESSAEPQAVFHCCCEDCRRSSGTGHCTHIVIPESAFSVTGDVTFFAHRSDSGNTVTKAFCGTCGSPIYSALDSNEDMIFLKTGTLDDTSSFSPQFHVWCDSKQNWVELAEGVPAMPTQ